MSDRTTRLIATLALALSIIAVVVALLAERAADDRLREIERLRDVLERLDTTRAGGRPSLALDPGDDP